jgi:putative tryptophan/tyrosine transport system substrate-binding protein
MRRRHFITVLGGAAVAWPLVAGARQAGKLPTIGFFGTPSAASWAPYTAAFVGRLRELGWVEGHTVAIEYRWADGREDRYAEIVAQFVQRKVDVIVTGGAGVLPAKRATSTIPIVFTVANDPLDMGLVASLSRPGGNVTGLSLQARDIAGKRLEFLREAVPRLHRLAIMAGVDYRAAMLEMGMAEAASRTLGIDAVKLQIQQAGDIAPAFAGLGGRADALYVCTGPLLGANQNSIIALAVAARLPTIYGVQGFVRAGGLMSYGPSLADLFRRAAGYVDKILRGAKPADLPVEQPTKFELVINLKTARALGLTMPTTLVALADQVIE